MSWFSTLRSWIFSRRIERDFARVARAIGNRPVPFLLGLGVACRLIEYARGRSFWMDEGFLWGNIKNTRITDFAPLGGNQLAPHVFLMVERILVTAFGATRYAARLLPLACGIAALYLFTAVSRRILSSRASLVAIVLFVFSTDLIYYSSELKPYSLDLMTGLAVTLTALALGDAPLRGRRAALLVLGLAVAPWLSFPSAFVVAGCGCTLFAVRLRTGQHREAFALAAIGLVWVTSFFLAYRAAKSLLNAPHGMYVFWNFAFLPVWPLPMSAERATATAGLLLEVFVNPLNLVVPALPWLSVLLCSLVMFTGAASLVRRSPMACSILVFPIALAIIASAARLYPFHGRLILELVPALFLLLAEGTDAIWKRDAISHKPFYAAMLVLILAYPCSNAVVEVCDPTTRGFNRHGDLRDNIFLRYGPAQPNPTTRP
jgi:hypothetical protein